MSASYIKAYGSHRAEPKGWVSRLGEDEYSHTFGGESWRVIDPELSYFVPVLLLVLDLKDPKLAALLTEDMDKLPLCSHINCSVWAGKQVFQIYPHLGTVVLVEREINAPESWETGFPIPLPEKRIKLCPMQNTDYPVNREQYWQACENFLNGTSFIRVLGTPLWIDPVLTEEDEHPHCSCNLPMQYVCAVGCEHELETSEKYVDGEPFYIGEGVLYFFLCRSCLRVIVMFQSV
jgi:hypothetical protein